ncbi:Cytochrome c oxidase assembly protein [Nymphaea thermarum]|nr:Cytochrome c oxidase assembly protein [Nymphaea thermarum]
MSWSIFQRRIALAHSRIGGLNRLFSHSPLGLKVLTVQFNADVADGMSWKFVPTQREVRVRPGESALAFYTAENLSSAPKLAAIYFNKIQCFCFEEQRLLPGEQVDMLVFFYVDPEFEEDPEMDSINNLILSYTFFKDRVFALVKKAMMYLIVCRPPMLYDIYRLGLLH